MRISMNTVTGVTLPVMVHAGGLARSLSDGLRIASVTGSLSARGDGPGWKTSLGDSRHFITDDGHLSATAGFGFRVLSLFVRSGLPRWWPSWAAVRDSVSPQAWAWDGSRWLREKSLFLDTM